MLERNVFFKRALMLALPIMVQNLISTLVGTADTIMLGYVNQTAMSAASLANQFIFVLFCFYYGMSAGTSVLCAQYWGKKDSYTIERIVGLALRLSIIISIVFVLIGCFFSKQIMSFFTNSPETIAIGATYLRVVSISLVFVGFTQVYLSALRSVGKVTLPSAVYVVSLITNIIFNAIFIFGLLGAPKLGVVGAAVGTVIARAVELIICIIYSIFFSDIKVRIRFLFASSGELMNDFLKIGMPAIVNDVIWSLASSAFAAILGHIGDDMVAANAVAIMVVNIGAIATRGFANATTIIVSNALGADDIEGAKVYSKRMLIITFVVSLIGCVIILVARPYMLLYYQNKLTPLAVSYLSSIMIMTTWRLIGEGLNTCWICGCFRGGGDTKFGMYMDLVFMWFVAVPLMFVAAYILKLPPLWVYLVMSLDEFYKMPVIIMHYKKFNWLNNITRDV